MIFKKLKTIFLTISFVKFELLTATCGLSFPFLYLVWILFTDTHV